MSATPPPARRRRTALATVAAAGLVVAGALGVVRPWEGSAGSPQAVAAPAPPAARAASSATPSPAPVRMPVSSAGVATPAVRPVPHDAVAAAAPTRFVYGGSRYTVRARVCGMEYVRPLDPPGDQHSTVCWVQHDFGYAPAGRSHGTTYVLGHSWAPDPREVLNPVSSEVMRSVLPAVRAGRSRRLGGVGVFPSRVLDGDSIVLRTPAGVLRYTVRSAYAVAKQQAGNVAPLMAERTRNRVVVITCGELGGVDYDYDIVVEAYLTSSVSTAS